MIKDFYKNLQAWLNNAKYEAAPPEDKAEAAIKLLEEFSEWETPEKKTGRVFDDKKFFSSVLRQYKKKQSANCKTVWSNTKNIDQVFLKDQRILTITLQSSNSKLILTKQCLKYKQKAKNVKSSTAKKLKTLKNSKLL